jgi:hypothetical protein
MMDASAVSKKIGWAILYLASLLFAVRGFYSQSHFLQSRDFKPLYAGARCILHHENPYDDEALRREFILAHGDMRDPEPLAPHYLLYPPPALFLVLPFALFQWPVAHLLFLAALAALLVAASFLIADLCMPYSPILLPVLISVFLLGANQLMILAQPAGPAIGLCVLGAVLLLKQKHIGFAVLCFSLSLTIKPHLGALIWLYFAIDRRFRMQAVLIAALTVLLCLPSVLWLSFTPASAHWMHDLQQNLKITELKGALSDPGPGNLKAYYITTLQTVVSLFNDNKAFYTGVTWLICGTLFVLWLIALLRIAPSRERDFFALATMSCLSMLPMYHRAYDTKLLLLCFPALALVFHQARLHWMQRSGKWTGFVGWSTMAAVLVVLIENDRYNYRLYAAMSGPDPAHLLKTIVLLRNIPVALLLQAILYLALLWKVACSPGGRLPGIGGNSIESAAKLV